MTKIHAAKSEQPIDQKSSVSRSDERLKGASSRRKALAVLLAGGLGLAIGWKNCNSQSSEDVKEQTAEVKKPSDRREIALGNVRLYLEQPDSLSAEKRIELFANMEKAYGRLIGYFGPEVVRVAHSANVPIVIGQTGIEGGMVSWNTAGSINLRGELDLTGKPEPTRLLLSDISESNLAHEFVHLFVQAPVLWSQAFYEGNAYAIQNTLYPPDRSLESVNDIADHPAISSFLDFGLDFHGYDKELKGGIQSGVMYRLALAKWEYEWKEFLKIEPDFFKKFYSEMARQRKGGKSAFSKNELEDIGRKVSGSFDQWYAGMKCMKSIGEDGEAVKSSSILIKSKRIMFSGYFQTHARKIDGEKITPPFLSPLAIGRLRILSHIDGQEAVMYADSWDNYCALTRVPDQAAEDPNIRVDIVK